jgi:large subunit ribosomal protein L33
MIQLKKKHSRVLIRLECLKCLAKNILGFSLIAKYTTIKNKANSLKKLNLKKYCKICNSHTVHTERC